MVSTFRRANESVAVGHMTRSWGGPAPDVSPGLAAPTTKIAKWGEECTREAKDIQEGHEKFVLGGRPRPQKGREMETIVT